MNENECVGILENVTKALVFLELLVYAELRSRRLLEASASDTWPLVS